MHLFRAPQRVDTPASAGIPPANAGYHHGNLTRIQHRRSVRAIWHRSYRNLRHDNAGQLTARKRGRQNSDPCRRSAAVFGAATFSQCKPNKGKNIFGEPGALIMNGSNKINRRRNAWAFRGPRRKICSRTAACRCVRNRIGGGVLLAIKWAAEQAEMLQRGDTRKVFRIADDDFQKMRQARSMVPPGGRVDLEALHFIMTTLNDLTARSKMEGRIGDRFSDRASAACFRTAYHLEALRRN